MPKPRLETTGLRSTEWLAGLYEGEGTLYRKGTGWNIRIKMTDKDICDSVSKLWNVNILGPYEQNSASMEKLKKASNSTKEWKSWYEVQTAKRDKIYEIVCDLYPYMGERRREKMNEFIHWYQNVQQKEQD